MAGRGRQTNFIPKINRNKLFQWEIRNYQGIHHHLMFSTMTGCLFERYISDKIYIVGHKWIKSTSVQHNVLAEP